MSSVRRQYPFHLIEPKWQQFWERHQVFRAWNPGDKIPADHPFAARHSALPPKYYILDMFPYPSGAGLHVGHPEGYTATDILARYRRALGFNVLHPMGWDAFGLPAEQYAIKTGQHPRQTTEQNIATFKRQIQSLGFSYDWTREVDTTDPRYFKWTQWIFLKLYNSWFNPETKQAEPIEFFDDIFSEAPKRKREWAKNLTWLSLHEKWRAANPEERIQIKRRQVDDRRLAYVAEADVWWCEALGTVLANEEVVEGKSEVGGHPVVRKPMRQWMLRITAYAERLLSDLDTIDWSHSLKEMQRNWIGRSEGARVKFSAEDPRDPNAEFELEVFTTRPDTLFGATYMVLSPEHRFVEQITTLDQREAVAAYKSEVAKKSDLERTELAKEKTGVFTGAHALNPVTGQQIPIWIADYVLASYGTGAIMGVPGHDTRDLEFAQKFNLPIVQVVQPPDSKTDWRGFVDEGTAINSANPEISLNGFPTAKAKNKITAWLESKGLGKKTINYKLRDWLFSRQRYWGEPFPIVWKTDANGNEYHEALPESALPVLPPALDDYKPTPDGQPPLARAQGWVNLPDGSRRETNTMPQWAGSCWYYLRYLDAKNESAFVTSEAERYWMGAAAVESLNRESVESAQAARPASTLQPFNALTTPGVDLYVGGTEHAVLHLLYARFWHKVLFDLGYVSTPEPFFKLVNQGLILGEDGQKMSKARGNVVNPDDMVSEFGADSLRLYEMFMGPLEMVKPWNTKGVEGVYRFLGRVWRLFIDPAAETDFEQAQAVQSSQGNELLERLATSQSIREIAPTPAQLRTLHQCIKKVTEDLEGLRFNTAISALMVFVNEAIAWEVKPLSVMGDFLILLQPFAPHLAEELHAILLRHHASDGPATKTTAPLRVPSTLAYVPWPKHDAAWLKTDTLEIPVQVNGKLRDRIIVAAEASSEEIEATALASDKIKLFLDGKTIKKIIVVPKRLVNIAAG